MLRRLPILALALAAVLPAGAADIRQKTTYFTVRGETLEELDRDLGRKGPLMSATGSRHPGATEVKFGGKVTYKPKDGSCRVASTALTLNLVETLPKWSRPKAASTRTAIIWKTLSDDIARHEAQHSNIARTYVKKMESALRNLAPERDCDAMEARVNAVSARYLAWHQDAQTQFDVIEGREMNMRLRRLLKLNVAEATQNP
ncbi:peptidase [Aureimonas sp. SA4125]|uniref:DUF922 domain-containing Zn-dependent protease n=1 Tax=Aureimonas sp. SA4125 TaxID=2826993 RepID=UPI001CC38D71|nr:DUF922 domain-containing protein [Aureimonas sp. SA4125]BDA85094.1 peptidase [Aureimonas sp. SA4125]